MIDLETAPKDRAAINRENASHSTGPKTEAGKQRSCMNALRHGMTSQAVVMPWEDLQLYMRHCFGYIAELQPVGKYEGCLVQSIADSEWRLERATNMEKNAQAIGIHNKWDAVNTENEQVHNALAMAVSLEEQVRMLAVLSIHQQRLERTISRKHKELLELQAARRKKE